MPSNEFIFANYISSRVSYQRLLYKFVILSRDLLALCNQKHSQKEKQISEQAANIIFGALSALEWSFSPRSQPQLPHCHTRPPLPTIETQPWLMSAEFKTQVMEPRWEDQTTARRVSCAFNCPWHRSAGYHFAVLRMRFRWVNSAKCTERNNTNL